MKKILLASFLILGSFAYSENINLPDDVEKSIRSSIATFSGIERRENYEWYKESYLAMIDRLDKSGIPDIDKKAIINRLGAMYGGNYPKQLAKINDEIAEYKNLVNRIREEQVAIQEKIQADNQKSMQEIKEVVSTAGIPQKELEKIQAFAKEEFPENFSLQKAYIQGAIRIYKEFK